MVKIVKDNLMDGCWGKWGVVDYGGSKDGFY